MFKFFFIILERFTGLIHNKAVRNFYSWFSYTQNGTLLIDKDHFATYPRACDQALVIQAEGEVPGFYSAHSPPLQWDNGPSCGVVLNGSASNGPAIVCSGSEGGGPPVGNIECKVYLYDTEGNGPYLQDRSYPGLSCYDDEP